MVNTKILKFGVSHSSVKVAVLSKHTIRELIDIICRETSVGQGGETVDCHMWNVSVGENTYESGDVACESEFRASKTKISELGLALGTKLRFEYDYGSTMIYTITFLGEESLLNQNEENMFPRKQVSHGPSTYTKFVPADSIDLNSIFGSLNKWAFVEGESVTLNLFQPGKKTNHGYVERGNNCIKHMIFMPAAAPKDLAAYLHCFNFGTQFKPGGSYNWFSLVVLPNASATETVTSKWTSQEKGFVEATRVCEEPSILPLNGAFPKVAALAGFRKDPNVKKGWMTYKDGNLRICSGKARSQKSNAPPGTAFHGSDHHEPESANDLLFEMSVKVGSLHDLFCVAEGILRSV